MKRSWFRLNRVISVSFILFPHNFSAIVLSVERVCIDEGKDRLGRIATRSSRFIGPFVFVTYLCKKCVFFLSVPSIFIVRYQFILPFYHI